MRLRGRGGMGLGGGEKRAGGWYWLRREDGGERGEGGRGIVAAFGWMLSKPRNLAPYARLYAAAGWDSLVCHAHVLNLWFPARASALAVQILDELAEEVEERPRPIVFATFSGGAKACLYKILQILQRTEEGGALSTRKYDKVRACVAGQIHDSSPVDFVSSLGARFVSSTAMQKSGRSSAILPVMVQAGAKLLDALFLPQFELQRADYWLTLRQSANMGPILIMCSTNDDLAPFDTIHKFANTMQELGCQVNIVVWDTSQHVGHFRNFPNEYRTAVTSFLDQQRLNHTWTPSEGEVSRDGMEETTIFGKGHPEDSTIDIAVQQDESLQAPSTAFSGSDTQFDDLHNAAGTTNTSNAWKIVGLRDTSAPIRRLPLNSKL